MSRLALRVIAVVGVIGLLGAGSFAIAGEGTRHFKAKHLEGYQENPDVSTVATGSFDARLAKDGQSISYELSYSGLEGAVQQAHVHFGKRAVNGGVSFFLCTNLGNGPAGTPACPPSGTVTGTIGAAGVLGPAGQGIEAGNLAEIAAAMRAGNAYANVHSTKWPGGEIRGQINERGHGHGKHHDDEDDD